MRKIILHNKKLQHDYAPKFQGLFGIPLASYMDMITGFDILAFDGWLETPYSISTEQYLLTKYGEQGVELVRALIA